MPGVWLSARPREPDHRPPDPSSPPLPSSYLRRRDPPGSPRAGTGARGRCCRRRKVHRLSLGGRGRVPGDLHHPRSLPRPRAPGTRPPGRGAGDTRGPDTCEVRERPRSLTGGDLRHQGRGHPLPDPDGGIYLKGAACLAGIGVMGRNNLVIVPGYGPGVRFRAIRVDLAVPGPRLPRVLHQGLPDGCLCRRQVQPGAVHGADGPLPGV